MPKAGRRSGSEHVSGLDRSILIVTGSTFEAERHDRPVAYALREVVGRGLDPGQAAVVCSDVWYLNSEEARARPTISVGPPASNALAAYLADRIDTVFAVDGQWCVQMDLEGLDAVASVWGVDEETTAKAAAAFRDKYLPAFMNAVRAARADGV